MGRRWDARRSGDGSRERIFASFEPIASTHSAPRVLQADLCGSGRRDGLELVEARANALDRRRDALALVELERVA